MELSIQYLKRKDINTEKWDRCIDTAGNGLIYAYSIYLDSMAKNWDALVMGDYAAVMPLPWNSKWGIPYLYQPAFTASLGIFGIGINETICKKFVHSIPKNFKLIELEFNYGNSFPENEAGISFRNNYILSLEMPYDTIFQGFRENVKRNIRKANQIQCTYSKDIPIEDIVALSASFMSTVSKVKPTDYDRFSGLFRSLKEIGKAITRGVYSPTGELVASCVYFFSHQRSYYILVGNHPNSKTMGASHFLIDRFIEEFSTQKLLLDFEGSDLGNIAFFYSSFGACLETYPSLRVDRLPWWVRAIKRI